MHTDETRERIDELGRARAWPEGLVDRFAALLADGPEEHLYRMILPEVADRLGADEEATLDLLLHATRLGLLDLRWHVCCPRCARIMNSLAQLTDVHDSAFCDLCMADEELAFDEMVQITFTVRPAVRAIRFHDPASVSPGERMEYCLLSRAQYTADGRRFVDRVYDDLKVARDLAPGELFELRFEAACGLLVGSQRFKVPVTPDGEARELELDIDSSRMIAGTQPPVRAGPQVFRARNRTDRTILLHLFRADGYAPPTIVRGLTALRLVHNPTWRRLFAGERPGRPLRVQSVALLFTDLRGSTALYAEIGDLAAYHLVQRHFAVLREVCEAHGGVLIKTVGDAIMASFPEPVGAARAGRAMIERVRDMRQGLGIKVGVHAGPCIAVELDGRLDYFGQVVNVASRVQATARRDELCATAAVANRAPGVFTGGTVERVAVAGVEGPLTIHRLAPR